MSNVINLATRRPVTSPRCRATNLLAQDARLRRYGRINERTMP